jgi:hypothetical protein
MTTNDDYSGYVPLKPTARANSIDSDHVGPNPRQTPLSQAERQQFEAIREKLDRALQATGVVPSMPQESQSPQQYEASLLRALAKHTSGRAARLEFSPQETPEGTIKTLEKLDVVADAIDAPRREGRLAAIRTTDRTGREITEFTGDKSQWMRSFKAPVLASPIHLDGVPQRV